MAPRHLPSGRYCGITEPLPEAISCGMLEIIVDLTLYWAYKLFSAAITYLLLILSLSLF